MCLLWNFSQRSRGGERSWHKFCVIKVESIPPVLAYKHNKLWEMRMAAQWHCSNPSLQHKHQRYKCSDPSGHKHGLRVFSSTLIFNCFGCTTDRKLFFFNCNFRAMFPHLKQDDKDFVLLLPQRGNQMVWIPPIAWWRNKDGWCYVGGARCSSLLFLEGPLTSLFAVVGLPQRSNESPLCAGKVVSQRVHTSWQEQHVVGPNCSVGIRDILTFPLSDLSGKAAL